MNHYSNPGAELWLGIRHHILDHGYIELVDYMGADATVVAAARHSYGKATDVDDLAGNTKLINYLMKHKHTSPFEQPALVFEVQAPIFVFREWHRHRTAKLNEMSGRYTELPELFYVPSADRVQAQSKTNKQGSGEALSPEIVESYLRSVDWISRSAFADYQLALEQGVSRELARIILPVNTYSKMVWQSDLSNLLKFLTLRTAEAAQFEIRQFALAIERVVSYAFPITYQAWKEYK